MNSSQQPATPDPVATAKAQGEMNRETAITQYGLNATNQRTPYGNLTYNQIGKWDDGTPRYESSMTLSPEQQRLYGLNTQTQEQLGQIGVDQTRKVAGILNTPFDFNSSISTQQSDMQRQLLDPVWSAREAAHRTRLANSGIQEGSEAYTNAMRDFGDERSRNYNSALLASRGQAASEALTNRNQPLNEILALLRGSAVTQPSFTNTPQSNVAPVDYTGLVNNNYNAQVAQYQADQARQGALFGGLGSIAGMGLGGWASGGFKKAWG